MLALEKLEERIECNATWHYTPGDNFIDGNYVPASVGFNLVDVNTPAQLNLVPAGDKALVDVQGNIGNTPDFPTFVKYVTPFLNSPKVFGFYLQDEPNPNVVPASLIKAESDWIHANDPWAKVFIVLGPGPIFSSYTPTSTDVDLVGLDPYPIRTWGVHYEYIPEAVLGAELLGWDRSQMIPVYQTFGNAGSFVLPTGEQEQTILAIWGFLTPNPEFDYAFSWGDLAGNGLLDSLDMQVVLGTHNMNPPLTFQGFVAFAQQRFAFDAYTTLSTSDPSQFGLAAHQAYESLLSNPWAQTIEGQIVEENIDQIFANL